MYQISMFDNAFKEQKYLGDGYFSTVHRIKPGWVIKHAKRRDCTLNYLEWCMRMQAAGEDMPGMPEIDFLVHTVNGYIVTMREYDPLPIEHHTGFQYFPECDYIDTLVDAWTDYMTTTFGESPDWRAWANDLHGGNLMVTASGNYILTDPSSYDYYDEPYVENFELEATVH